MIGEFVREIKEKIRIAKSPGVRSRIYPLPNYNDAYIYPFVDHRSPEEKLKQEKEAKQSNLSPNS